MKPDKLYSPEEAASREERQRYYNDKVSQLVQFAYQNAPAVKARLDKAGVKPSQVRTTRDLEGVPAVTRDELIKLQEAEPPFGGLKAVSKLHKILFSPGPIYVPVASIEYARSIPRIFHAAGLRKDDVVLCTLPGLFIAGALFEDGLALAEMIAIPAGAGNTELQVNLLRNLGVKGYVGTPSFLMNLVKKAEELGYNFHREFKLKSAVLTAEPLLPEVRNTLEKDYGISLTNVLGLGVGTTLGFECSRHNGFHMLEEAFVEIVDPETGKQLPSGETGAMLVTAFNNEAFPLVRYKTGDLSSISDEPCPCGRTSVRLMGIKGRIGDSVKVRALYLTPDLVKTVATRFPQVSKYQVVVRRVGYKDEMIFKLEVSGETPEREKLANDLQTSFQDACRLRIDRIDFVPRGTIPDGHKVIVDERN